MTRHIGLILAAKATLILTVWSVSAEEHSNFYREGDYYSLRYQTVLFSLTNSGVSSMDECSTLSSELLSRMKGKSYEPIAVGNLKIDYDPLAYFLGPSLPSVSVSEDSMAPQDAVFRFDLLEEVVESLWINVVPTDFELHEFRISFHCLTTAEDEVLLEVQYEGLEASHGEGITASIGARYSYGSLLGMMRTSLESGLDMHTNLDCELFSSDSSSTTRLTGDVAGVDFDILNECKGVR